MAAVILLFFFLLCLINSSLKTLVERVTESLLQVELAVKRVTQEHPAAPGGATIEVKNESTDTED